MSHTSAGWGHFDSANLTNANMSDSMWEHARFHYANFTNATLDGSNTRLVKWEHATWDNTTCSDGSVTTGKKCKKEI